MEPVRFRDCACPGTPHPNGDTVTFKPKLSFDENVAAFAAIMSPPKPGLVSQAWGVYLHAGPVAWNLLDEEGDPVPLTDAALDALSFAEQYTIADKADDLYGATVATPLARLTSEFSKNSPTPDTSPPPSSSSETPQGRRKRS